MDVSTILITQEFSIATIATYSNITLVRATIPIYPRLQISIVNLKELDSYISNSQKKCTWSKNVVLNLRYRRYTVNSNSKAI